MEINVNGVYEPKNKLLEAITRHTIKKLMPRGHDQLVIDVVSTPFISRNAHGFLTTLDCARRPKMFQIDINANMAWNYVVTTVTHECVHLKQYARDQMYEYTMPRADGYDLRWKGQLYKWPPTFTNVKTDTRYWFTPWEMEAYGMQDGLGFDFKAHHPEYTQQVIRELCRKEKEIINNKKFSELLEYFNKDDIVVDFLPKKYRKSSCLKQLIG